MGACQIQLLTKCFFWSRYDMIVIGAGTSGSVFLHELAKRQQASGPEGRPRVLVVEAGGPTLASLGGSDFPS